MAKKPTNVRLDEEIIAALRAEAQARRVSVAELIRQAIIFYLGWLHGQKPGSK